MPKTRFAKELKDKDVVNEVFLVKYSAVVQARNGKPYLNCVLSDRSGDVESRVWENAEAAATVLVKGTFVRVEGRVSVFQGKRQFILNAFTQVPASQIEMKEFVPEARCDVDALYLKVLEYARSLENPFSRELALKVLTDEDVSARLRQAPAAKSVHHAYRGGLIEHMVSIAGILDDLSKHYGPVLDRDLLMLGGFFHDIAKLWELEYALTTDYTDEGRLVGHLVMGVELVERVMNTIPEFPRHLRLLVKHLILAHHGELEYGSPKRPKCLEALVVHYVDDLDSKINAIQGFIEKDENPGDWTLLNKMYERYFYKGPKSVSKQ
ncbi:MAG: HD domain-containing protein [Deltaproteobacteria bacterium]|nr:HD domain-containing protein [Deltaproteobacteria bacterium]